MKRQFVLLIAVSAGLSSCREEDELSAKYDELEAEVEERRKRLSKAVKEADKFEVTKSGEDLVDLELQVEHVKGQLKSEAEFQKDLEEQKKQIKSDLNAYQKRYSIGG